MDRSRIRRDSSREFYRKFGAFSVSFLFHGIAILVLGAVSVSKLSQPEGKLTVVEFASDQTQSLIPEPIVTVSEVKPSERIPEQTLPKKAPKITVIPSARPNQLPTKSKNKIATAIPDTVPTKEISEPLETSQETPIPEDSPAETLEAAVEDVNQSEQTAEVAEDVNANPVEAEPVPEPGPQKEVIAKNENEGSKSEIGVPEGVLTEEQLGLPILSSAPSYPTKDKLRGHQGDSVLRYTVNSDGSVTNIRTYRSSGSKEMDEASSKALARYKYKAGRTAEVIKVFSFRLRGEARYLPSRLRSGS